MLRYIVRNNKYCRLINPNTFIKNSDTNSFKNFRSSIKRYISGDSEKMSNEGGDNLKNLSDKEWKKRLTPEQYDICRQKGTEIPFTGKYTFHKEEGVYNCVCCGATLFSSKAKFISGCGWPSFNEAYEVEGKDGKKRSNIEEREDHSHGMKRTEVVCSECKAHLGHVFPDGPPPHGLRYCINSVALQFQKKKLE